MTPLENKIVQFIHSFYSRHGYSASIQEIARGLGHQSKGTIYRYLQGLVKQGELKKADESGRAVYLRESSHLIPLTGRIAAGSPIEAVTESERLNFFDRFTEEGLYQLIIRGDSMIDIGICEGDIVLIKPVRKAENKQIVVALIDGSEATLKRYFKRGRHIELHAENADYPPQIYPAERVEIQGILHSVHKFSF